LQVIRWIHSAEGMLSAGFSIPGSLADAEQLKKEHEQFQTAIEVTVLNTFNSDGLCGVNVLYFYHFCRFCPLHNLRKKAILMKAIL
jgi:hypothetical protein